MGYWSQFESFDPKKSEVPYDPYIEAVNITWRARSLLSQRSSEQIEDLASTASSSIDHYFEVEKDDEIARLVREKDDEFIEFDYDGEGFGWRFRDEKEDELNIATADNTSEVEALKLCLDSWSELTGCNVPESKGYEFFAAMALWNIGDYLRRRSHRYDFVDKTFMVIAITKFEATDFRSLAEILFKAIQAVDYAERLQREDELEKRCQKRIDKLELSKSDALEKLAETIRIEAVEQAKAEEAMRWSQRAKELGHLRHQKTYQAKNIVLPLWEANKSSFNSAEKAGLHYADWLDKEGFKYEPRTVTSWIRAYAKEKNIRLR